MSEDIRNRVINEANYMLETKDTIRNIAKEFNISKSSVHKDLSYRLEKYDIDLYNRVKEVLNKHLEERHIKGGEETKRKYKRRDS